MMGGGGGGGGYFGGPVGSEDIERLRREAEARATSAGLEAEVNGLLRDVLAAVGQRDVETVQGHLEQIERALGKDIEGTEKLLFGGSVAKHTYVDGLSDIDSLVLLAAEAIEGRKPRELIAEFARSLRDRLAPAQVETLEKGSLAVTVTFRDGTIIQLLPAYRVAGHFAVSDGSGAAWRQIRPRDFAKALTDANERLSHQLIPTIKLAKLLIQQFPERRHLDGYHTEALALEAFRAYDGPRTLKSMSTHFFTASADLVKRPIADRTGQSWHVDDDLGPSDSSARREIADSLARLGRRMQHATSIDHWREFLKR